MSSLYNASQEKVGQIAKSRARIPDDIYPDIQKWANTPTTDFICTRMTSVGAQFLLVKRSEPPWKGEWFVPGGRILPGMEVEDSCRTNVRRELGLDNLTIPPDFKAIIPVFNPESQSGGEPWFSLWHLFEVPLTADEEKSIKLDQTGKEFQWFSKNQNYFPDPVKRAVASIGFIFD